ncbi:MAG: endonuclease/exonuclease/phosphatase family protein [Anaerolineae bacterium]
MVSTASRFFSYVSSLVILPWRVSQGLLWLWAIWLLAWQVLRWWPGDRWWPVAISNYFTPWILLTLIPALALTLLTRQRSLSLALALSALVIGVRLTPLFLFKSSTPADAGTLKVMTFNIHKRNDDIEGIIKLVLEEEPDVIALQELTTASAEQLLPALEARYPYHTLRSGRYIWGQGLLSRYPFEQTSPLPSYNYQSTVLATPQGPVTFFNIHTPTPFDWERQHRAVQSLAGQIAGIEGPLIVVGDFNTTDQAENYGLVRRYLQDAFHESGWGFGFSFPARPRRIRWLRPLVRIDYIFHSEHFVSQDTRVLEDNAGSDHRPVVSTLSLTSRQPLETAWR